MAAGMPLSYVILKFCSGQFLTYELY